MSSYNLLSINKDQSESSIISELNAQDSISIKAHNWNVGRQLPIVTVTGGWNEEMLYLLFNVKEKESLRRFKTLNAPVYRDSCVEFFIQPDMKSPLYCNFEFNSLGTMLSQTGSSRENRVFIKEQEASTIRTKAEYHSSSLTEENQTGGEWKLFIQIPAEVLASRGITLQKDNQFRCNFYKCGDDLKDPHYLSWNPVLSEEPDFHRIDFFGQIILKSKT